MARKTETYRIDAEGRDQGKSFFITEMSATAAERWALRAFFAMANTGVDLPDGVEEMGMAGIATVGLQALGRVPFEQAEPLLDEMMTCVQIIPNPDKPNITRALIDSDIEEVRTRLELRKAVFDLHTGFFSPAESLTSDQASSANQS